MSLRTKLPLTLGVWCLLGCLATPGSGRADPATEEVERQRQEIKRLQDQLAENNRQIVQQRREIEEVRKLAVTAEIKAKSLLQRNEKLLAELAALQQELAKIKGEKSAPAPRNNPPQDVQGIIKKVEGGLLIISIGSDAGLQKGHTLEIYRTQPKPLYLGRLKIIDVRPTEAVGQMMDKAKDPIQVGDQVGSLAQR